MSPCIIRLASPLRRVLMIHLVVTLLLVLAPPLALAEEAPAASPPSYLSGNARAGFGEYARQTDQRAFALSPQGAWGYSYRQNTLEQARETALANCKHYASNHCEIIAENDRIIAPEYPFETAPATPGHPSPLAFTEGLAFSTIAFMGVTGLAVLLLGVRVARRYPVTYHFFFLPRTGEHYYVNWMLTPFTVVYLLCMSPFFHKAVTGGLTDILSWTLFVAPIVPLGLAPLYLHAKGALVHIHKQ